MTGSEKNTVLAKLRQVQMKLKAPKSQINSFGGYKYRNCEDILEAVKPLLDEAKLTLVLSDELLNIGDRYYVQATATVYDEESGQVSVRAIAREEETKKGMDAAQITGSASSYARKYALNGLFNIDDTKDADSHDNTQHVSKPTRKPKSSELATEKQRQLIQQKLADQGISQENTKTYLIEQFGVELPLTKEGASFVIEELIGGAA